MIVRAVAEWGGGGPSHINILVQSLQEAGTSFALGRKLQVGHVRGRSNRGLVDYLGCQRTGNPFPSIAP
jgi:hypothetical protein